MRHPIQTLLCAVAVTGVFGGDFTLRAVEVLSYHYDQVSSGVNSAETVLTPSDLTVSTFQKLYTTPVDSKIFTEPLYVPGVTVTGGTKHNLAIVGTQGDILYAIDATSGVIVWQTSFLVSGLAGATTITPEPSSDSHDQYNAAPTIGILGTPVIDGTTNLLYVVVKTKQILNSATATPNFVYSLYKIDLTSGNIVSRNDFADTIFDGTNYTFRTNTNPAAAQDPFVVGTGDGVITVNNQQRVYFNALRELNRSALILSNGIVYACFAAPSDYNPYHGWMLGFNKSTLAVASVFCTTPNGSQGGIWSSGGCPAVDSTQNIYVSTGNGTFDGTVLNGGVNSSGLNLQTGLPIYGDYGDSVLKLTTDSTTSAASQNSNGWGMKVTDYFSPSNNGSLWYNDLDVAGGGISILPDRAGSKAHPNLLVEAGKEGTIYLIDRDSMGKFTTTDQTVQSLLTPAIGACFDTPAFFNSTIYYAAQNDNGKAFAYANGAIGTTPVTTPDTFDLRGSTPIISANGTTHGVVWMVTANYESPGQLRAYSAANFATEIWTSDQAANGRDALGTGVRFSVPTVADGRVFVGTETTFVAYGLNPALVVITSDPPTSTTATGTLYTFTFTAAGTSSPVFTLTSGSLPPGLTLSPSGVLTGTPTKPGTYTGTVTASGSGLTATTQSFTITVTAGATPGVTDTPTMPLLAMAILAALLLIIAARWLPNRTAWRVGWLPFS